MAWVQSDGRLRTDEELLDELVSELGFRRRGSRIVATLTEAIDRAHRAADSAGPSTAVGPAAALARAIVVRSDSGAA